MLNRIQIEELLQALNVELLAIGVKGEIGIVGGSALCLAFNARQSTKDVDAIFEPSIVIRQAAERIANRYHIDHDWLNDAVKGFLSSKAPQKNIIFDFSNLKVWIPEPQYLLAMKVMAARVDTKDKGDIIFLIKHLRLTSSDEVFGLVLKYFPRNLIPIKSQYFIEELFDDG
jgi:hypothetical protein